VLTGLAAAAMVMMIVGGWMLYQQATLKPLDLQQVAENVKRRAVEKPTPADIEKEYKARGVEMKAPTAFNYAFFDHHGLEELQGRQVPYLFFIRDDDRTNIHAHAKVYVVSAHEFKVDAMPQADAMDPGYGYRIEVSHEPGARFAYVVVYTGEN